MWQKSLITAALLASLGVIALAQEPKPKNPPPEGGPRQPGVGPGVPGGRGQRGPGGGPQGERGKGPFINNPPFAGRGPKGEGMRGDGPRGDGTGPLRGPGFMPGGQRMNDFERLRREDPEMFDLLNQDDSLLQQTEELADQVRQAPAEQREKLKTQLADLIDKHFDVRQQRRELQLKRMEAELGRLREAIKQRNETRATIIKERMTELVGEAKGLGF